MLPETIAENPVNGIFVKVEERECLEVTCPVCGQSPIVIPVSIFMTETAHECPSCDMKFRHSFRH